MVKPPAGEGAVSVSIERLVLRGVPPDARAAIGAAVERALGGLIAARGLPPGMARAPVVELAGGSLCVTAGPGAEAIGEAIAARILRGVVGGGRAAGVRARRAEARRPEPLQPLAQPRAATLPDRRLKASS